MPYHWLDFTPPRPQIAAAPVANYSTAAHIAKEIGAFSRIPAPDNYYFTMDWQRVNNPSINLSRV